MKTISILFITALAITGCQKAEESAATANEEATELQAPTDGPTWSVGGVEEREMSELHRLQGRWESIASGAHVVAFPSAVQVRRYAVAQGASVRKGELLAYISHPELVTLQEQYIQARAAWDYQKVRSDRYAILKERNEIGEVEWQKVVQEGKEAKATFESASAALFLYGVRLSEGDEMTVRSEIPVYAPADGRVSAFEVTPGGFLAAEQPLLTLQPEGLQQVRFEVPWSQIGAFAVGDRAVVLWGGAEVEGRISRIGASSDRDGSVALWVELSEKVSATSGAFVSGQIYTGHNTYFALPNGGIYTEGETFYVVGRKSGGEWEKLAVELGPNDGKFTGVHLSEEWHGAEFITSGIGRFLAATGL